MVTFCWFSYIFTLKYEWIAAVASLRILNRELKALVLHLRWGNWRIYSTACLSLILKGKSWNQTMQQKTWKRTYIFYKVRINTVHILQWLLYTLERDTTIFHTRGSHSPTTRILSASSSTGCFWLGLCFRRPVTSTAQPNVSNLIWEQQKAVSYIWGGAQI